MVHDVKPIQILDWKTYADRKLIFRKEFIINFKEYFHEEFRRLDCNRKTSILSICNNLEPLHQSQLPIKKENTTILCICSQ